MNRSIPINVWSALLGTLLTSSSNCGGGSAATDGGGGSGATGGGAGGAAGGAVPAVRADQPERPVPVAPPELLVVALPDVAEMAGAAGALLAGAEAAAEREAPAARSRAGPKPARAPRSAFAPPAVVVRRRNACPSETAVSAHPAGRSRRRAWDLAVRELDACRRLARRRLRSARTSRAAAGDSPTCGCLPSLICNPPSGQTGGSCALVNGRQVMCGFA